MGAVASGSHSDGHFSGNAGLLDETRQSLAEVVERLTLSGALTVGAKTGSQLRVRTPHAVLVALDDDRHGDRPETCHDASISSDGRNQES